MAEIENFNQSRQSVEVKFFSQIRQSFTKYIQTN